MKINIPNQGIIPNGITIELDREELIQLAAVCGRVSGVRDKIFSEIYHLVYSFSDSEKKNLNVVNDDYEGCLRCVALNK